MFWAALLLAAFFATPGIAETLPPDRLARIYAGLDGSDPGAKPYRQRMDAAWNTYQKRLGQPMSAWAAREIANPGGGTVFYPFSGPDFVTVAQLFPNAERYVLVAIQSAREPAQPQDLPPARRRAFDDKFGREWRKFGSLGFFRTDDLDDDVRDRRNPIGITTILMTFAARLGYTVENVTPISLNRGSGEFEPDVVKGPWQSVRLTLSRNGKTTRLDYIRMDLSNSGLQREEGRRQAWIAAMTRNPVLLKAASHLLPKPNFSLLAKAIAESAPLVLQDETGLDYKQLKAVGGVKLYGRFTRPHHLFDKRSQASLAAAYRATPATDKLPFSFSYNKSAETNSLQLARRSGK